MVSRLADSSDQLTRIWGADKFLAFRGTDYTVIKVQTSQEVMRGKTPSLGTVVPRRMYIILFSLGLSACMFP
jgi:hypothetical protein